MKPEENVFEAAAESAASAPRTSRLAIAAFASANTSLAGLLFSQAYLPLVFLFMAFPAAIVCGHLARRRIAAAREGQLRGEGMATYGLAVGYFAAFISLLAIYAISQGR